MKKKDQDIKALGLILRGCKASTSLMLRANLMFAWDKFVSGPECEKFRNLVGRKP